jgi:hypothetical protein
MQTFLLPRWAGEAAEAVKAKEKHTGCKTPASASPKENRSTGNSFLKT